MDHDHQLERYSISDVKSVELLVEQLIETPVVFARVAGDARGSIEHSRRQRKSQSKVKLFYSAPES